MIIRKDNTRKEDKWLNACGVDCGTYTSTSYFGLPDEDCEDECYGGGEEPTQSEIIEELGTFCETNDGWLAQAACWGADQLSSLTLKDLMDMRNMACQIKPEMGICSNGTPPPSGCASGKYLCKKNGITQCAYESDCDDPADVKPESTTNWGMIAAIGGGVLVLGITAIILLRKK